MPNQSLVSRALLGGVPLAAATLALAFAARPAAAQDVVQRGRLQGVEPPPSLLRRVEQDPTAYEFRRVWRQKTQRVRAARAALEQAAGPRLSIAQLQGAQAAVTGTMRVPVILGLYAGATAPYPSSAIQTRLFGSTPGVYSAKTYYQEISRGAFAVDGTVTPWFNLPQPASYYDPSAASDPTFGRTGAYLRDALNASDASIDFGQYDNDGPDGRPNSGDDDGYVDVATFVYPESGKACGGPGIWPHRWVYSAHWGQPYSTNDASARGGTIKVDDYLIMGSVACDRTSLMEIGTFAHEMGHGIGLPDLYDTYPNDGTGQGLGDWDLMATGVYRLESSPAHMGAWSKDFLGWVNVETVTASRTGYTLPPVYANGTVLRYGVPGTREYFLLEHREPVLSDAYMYGPGLLVYHVDPVVIDSTSFNNTVNSHPRLGVALVQADGFRQLDLGQNRGDAGDPFPGTSGRTTLTATTTPSSNSNDGQASGLALRNITRTGSTLSFDLAVEAVLQAPATVNLNATGGGSASTQIRVTSTPTVTVQATSGASWLTVAPASGPTPLDLSLTASSAGLAAGSYSTSLTLTAAGASNSPLRVTVNLNVGTPLLSLGDSLRATISREGEADTLRLNLTAGQLVDVGVFSESSSTLFTPRVRIISPGGVTTSGAVTRSTPRANILARYAAPQTGTYRVIVTDASVSSYNGVIMAYVLRTRTSGAVLDVVGLPRWHLIARGGAPETDTVSVVNYGQATGAFTVVADSAWVTASPTSGTALPTASGAPQPLAAAAPRGQPLVDAAGAPVPRPAPGAPVEAVGPATRVILQVTPGALPQGWRESRVVVRLPRDVWNGDVEMYEELRLHDPAAVVLTTANSGFPGYTALAPDGKLVMESGTNLIRVDTLTGAATVWLTGLSTQLSGMQFGPDSALYVADRPGSRVLRVSPQGVVTTLFSGTGLATSVAVAPDGTVYAAIGKTLVRQPRGGTASVVLTTTRSLFSYGIAYKDGYVYYTGGGELRRWDPITNTDQARGVIPATANLGLLNLSVGQSGRLYGTENNSLGSILVLSDDGTLLSRIWAPGVGWGATLANGRLFGSSIYPGDQVWKLSVADAPAPITGRLVGDPSGDGRITSMDALGVLSFVVGKPLPAGWNMTVAGDANCDGAVTAVDALVILSQVVNKDVSAFCVGRRR